MRKQLSLSALAAVVALTGCANMTEAQRGTATGAGIGAGVGAVIGAAQGGGKRTTTGAVVGAGAGAILGNIWSKQMEQQKRDMERATQGTGVAVTQTADNRLKLEIPSDISFATNRADIQPNFRPILDRFAQSLVEHPATTITIIGHTDSTGNDAINNPLSLSRADSARDYLTARGVNPQRVMIDGRGSREPVASNASEHTRAQNRRVEIFVAEPQTATYGGQQQPVPTRYPSSGQ